MPVTGCDLRFMAEGLISRSNCERTELRDKLYALATDLMFDLEHEPLHTVVAAITAHVNALRNYLDDDNAAARETSDAGYETIQKVREHFHEAVDARVQTELQDGERRRRSVGDAGARRHAPELGS